MVAFRFTGKELLERIGVTRTSIKATPHGDVHSFHRALADDERQQLQGHCDEVYRHFKEHVARGRDMDMAAVEEVAQGKVRFRCCRSRSRRRALLVVDLPSVQSATPS